MQKRGAKQLSPNFFAMKELPFALGAPRQESRTQRRTRLIQEAKWKRKQERRSTKAEACPKRPGWRILPSHMCKGYEFWMDTLKGDTYITKRAQLLDDISRFQDPPTCPWSFPVLHTNLRNDILKKGEDVLVLLRINQMLRWTFKRFLTLIRIRRMSSVNDKDPITMESIEEPIEIPFFSQRKLYSFEAETIAKYVHKQLVANEGTIPTPTQPRNPLTNQEFTLVQIMAILDRCKNLGHTSWALEGFVACRYDLESFLLFHRKPLRIHALRTTMAKVLDWDAIDTLYDFIRTQFDIHDAVFPRGLFKWAVRHATDHTQMQSWRRLCIKWYEVYILIDDVSTRSSMLAAIQEKTLPLCSSYRQLQTLRLVDGGRSS